MPEILKKENVNDSFFNGFYKDIWRHIFPEKTTQAETDFIIEEGGLTENSHVLDIMCGYGRHTLLLGKKGVHVLAVDNLQEYVDEIKQLAFDQNLPIECICDDVIQLRTDKLFDAAICMGNSIQFFDETATLTLLTNIAAQLKPGARFFINSWSLAEIVMKNFKEKSWNKLDNLVFLVESKFLLRPARVETNSIIITNNGEREEKPGVDYIFSIAEIEVMLNKSGFLLKEVYSIPGKKQFSYGDTRAYLVAEKK